MRYLNLVWLCLVVALGANAQTIVHDANAQIRQVPSFTGVRVSSGIELLLTQHGDQTVAVSIDRPEYQDAVVTEVKDGVLRIYFKENADLTKQKNSWKRTVKAYVSTPVLESLTANSGAKVKLNGEMKVASLSLDLSSGAVLDGRIEGQTLKLEQSSGSVSTLGGQVETITASLSSGAKCNGYSLSVKSSRLNVHSGAKIEMSVVQEVNAEAHSGGQIYYKGSGTVSAARTHSGGKVNHIQ
jgi:hypothetical protein